MSVTGKRIQERRKQLGISADMLAEHLGVSRSTIFRYENGSIEKFPANLVSRIAKYLQTSEKYLMGWEEEPGQSEKDVLLIMEYYEMLNDMGKHEATKRVGELTGLLQYVKDGTSYVNAAHAIPGALEEDRQFDEELMDDENF